MPIIPCLHAVLEIAVASIKACSANRSSPSFAKKQSEKQMVMLKRKLDLVHELSISRIIESTLQRKKPLAVQNFFETTRNALHRTWSRLLRSRWSKPNSKISYPVWRQFCGRRTQARIHALIGRRNACLASSDPVLPIDAVVDFTCWYPGKARSQPRWIGPKIMTISVLTTVTSIALTNFVGHWRN